MSEETLPEVEEAPAATPEAGFQSSYTDGFPGLLKQLGISLLISTYQAGKLIMVREDEGTLNTHFRVFASPMGVAFDPDTRRLAIGTRHQMFTFCNHQGVTDKLEPPGKHDAVFLPHTAHYSGDIRVHEVGWIDQEIWAVNTRFSCLCTFDNEGSFQPRWQPPFISALAAEDRCHLNGMAIHEGRIRLVSCLAQSDIAHGWREHKVSGGTVWDLDRNEALITGLCMPHSPRIYDGKIWVLESGNGILGFVDESSQKLIEVARLPGFTRGLSFAGPYAFVGLSQVRESAIFGGIPIAEGSQERSCGVWVVDLRTGATVAFLKFEGIVQEIFAVEILPGVRFPDLLNEPGPILDSSFILN